MSETNERKRKGLPKEEHERRIIEIITKNKLCRNAHIFGFYTEIGEAHFYDLGLNRSEAIKEALSANRSKASGYLLSKWIASDNATLQIAAMRLVCSEEERQALSQAYIEQKTTTVHSVAELENEVQAGEYTEEEREIMLRVARKSRDIYK